MNRLAPAGAVPFILGYRLAISCLGDVSSQPLGSPAALLGLSQPPSRVDTTQGIRGAVYRA